MGDFRSLEVVLVLNKNGVGEASLSHFLVDGGSDTDGDDGLVQGMIIFVVGGRDLVVFPAADGIVMINGGDVDFFVALWLVITAEEHSLRRYKSINIMNQINTLLPLQ